MYESSNRVYESSNGISEQKNEPPLIPKIETRIPPTQVHPSLERRNEEIERKENIFENIKDPTELDEELNKFMKETFIDEDDTTDEEELFSPMIPIMNKPLKRNRLNGI